MIQKYVEVKYFKKFKFHFISKFVEFSPFQLELEEIFNSAQEGVGRGRY